MIGSWQAFIWLWLANRGWPYASLAGLVLSFGIFVTGGIHLDGLMDTADGLAAGKEKRIEAMLDSRVGAIGMQALIVVLLIQFSALIKLGSVSPIALVISSFCSKEVNVIINTL